MRSGIHDKTPSKKRPSSRRYIHYSNVKQHASQLSKRNSKFSPSDNDAIFQSNSILQQANFSTPPLSTPGVSHNPQAQRFAPSNLSFDQEGRCQSGIAKSQSGDAPNLSKSFTRKERGRIISQPHESKHYLSDHFTVKENNKRSNLYSELPHFNQRQKLHHFPNNSPLDSSQADMERHQEPIKLLKRKLPSYVPDREVKSRTAMKSTDNMCRNLIDVTQNKHFPGSQTLKNTSNPGAVLIDLTDDTSDEGVEHNITSNDSRSNATGYKLQTEKSKLGISASSQSQGKQFPPANQFSNQRGNRELSYREYKTSQRFKNAENCSSYNEVEDHAVDSNYRGTRFNREQYSPQDHDERRSLEYANQTSPRSKINGWSVGFDHDYGQEQDLNMNYHRKLSGKNVSSGVGREKPFLFQTRDSRSKQVQGKMIDEIFQEDHQRLHGCSRPPIEQFTDKFHNEYRAGLHSSHSRRSPEDNPLHEVRSISKKRLGGNLPKIPSHMTFSKSFDGGELARRREIAENGDPFSDGWDDGFPLDAFAITKPAERKSQMVKTRLHRKPTKQNSNQIQQRMFESLKKAEDLNFDQLRSVERNSLLPMKEGRDPEVDLGCSEMEMELTPDHLQGRTERARVAMPGTDRKIDAMISASRVRTSNLNKHNDTTYRSNEGAANHNERRLKTARSRMQELETCENEHSNSYGKFRTLSEEDLSGEEHKSGSGQEQNLWSNENSRENCLDRQAPQPKSKSCSHYSQSVAADNEYLEGVCTLPEALNNSTEAPLPLRDTEMDTQHMHEFQKKSEFLDAYAKPALEKQSSPRITTSERGEPEIVRSDPILPRSKQQSVQAAKTLRTSIGEDVPLFVQENLHNQPRSPTTHAKIGSHKYSKMAQQKPDAMSQVLPDERLLNDELENAKKGPATNLTEIASKSSQPAKKPVSAVLKRLKKDAAKRSIGVTLPTNAEFSDRLPHSTNRNAQRTTPSQILTEDMSNQAKGNDSTARSEVWCNRKETKQMENIINNLSAQDALLLILMRKVPIMTWQDVGVHWRRICRRDDTGEYLEHRARKIMRRLNILNSMSFEFDPGIEATLYKKSKHLLNKLEEGKDQNEDNSEIHQIEAAAQADQDQNMPISSLPTPKMVELHDEIHESPLLASETLPAKDEITPHVRPMTGGKSLTPEQIATIHADIGDEAKSASDLESDSESGCDFMDQAPMRQGSPLDPEYRCHFLYHVYRRECAAYDDIEEQDFTPCGHEFTEVGDANAAATAEFMSERVNACKWPLVKWESQTDEHFMIHHKGSSFDGACLEVRVDRSLGLWVDGVPAELKAGAVARKVYDVWSKTTSTMRVDSPAPRRVAAERVSELTREIDSPIDNEKNIDALFEELEAATPSPRHSPAPAPAPVVSSTTTITFNPPTSLHTTLDQANRVAAALVLTMKFPLRTSNSADQKPDRRQTSSQVSPRLIERKHAAELSMASRLDELEIAGEVFSEKVVVGNQMTEVWVVQRELEGPRNI